MASHSRKVEIDVNTYIVKITVFTLYVTHYGIIALLTHTAPSQITLPFLNIPFTFRLVSYLPLQPRQTFYNLLKHADVCFKNWIVLYQAQLLTATIHDKI
jgi:hypothetical protein